MKNFFKIEDNDKMIIWFMLACLCCFWLFGCQSWLGDELCYNGRYENVTDYDYTITDTTPGGVQVSADVKVTPEILNTIDKRFNIIDQCLQEFTKDTPYTEPEWECLTYRLFNPKPLNKDCIIIKIVEPAERSCSKWQLLDVEAPAKLCEDKGLTVTPECPCRFRWAIIDNNVLVTPEDIYLYDLLRLATGCNNIWASKKLRACALLGHADLEEKMNARLESEENSDE